MFVRKIEKVESNVFLKYCFYETNLLLLLTPWLTEKGRVNPWLVFLSASAENAAICSSDTGIPRFKSYPFPTDTGYSLPLFASSVLSKEKRANNIKFTGLEIKKLSTCQQVGP